MKKITFFFLAIAMVFSPASIGHAEDPPYLLLGRELSPGIQYGDTFYGALFLGKIFVQCDSDGELLDQVGYFSVVLDRKAEGVEECGYETEIINFKLIMNFNDRSRLLLVMVQESARAEWYYDDPFCPDGCVFPGYDEYLTYIEENEGLFPDCQDNLNDNSPDNDSLIAGVPTIELKKQWFGSWGWRAKGVIGADISGWLVHTPLLIPAVFGTVTLDRLD